MPLPASTRPRFRFPQHCPRGAARLLLLGLACRLGAGVALTAAELRVEQLDLREIQQAYAPASRSGEASGGGPLRVGRITYPAGFGTSGASRLELALDGRGETLTARTGVDDTSGPLASVRFLVVGDGRVLYRGPWQQRFGPAVPLQVEVRGVQRLALVADVRGEPYARADWLAPVLTHAGTPPVAVAPESAVGEILAPPPAVAPRFNLPAAVGVRPGHPFLQRVNVAGARPLQLVAEHLPRGVTFNAERQVLEGVAPAEPGEHTILLRAENHAGRAACALRLVVGDTLALTPSQGWSSWYGMSFKVSDAWVREAAEALLRTGLADHGWTLVKLDEAWMTRPGPDDPRLVRLRAQEKLGRSPGYWKGTVNDPTFAGPARDAQGRILPNARFPDMPALTAWLHARGLQAGIYSSPGVLTCGGCTGSFGHETEDAAQFAAWGFDFLMYDWCAYSLETEGLEQADWERPYARMGAALRAQPRDIVFNLCQYGHASVWTWGAKVGGQSWRVDQDLMDTWGAVAGAGFFGEERDRHAGPGRWNDLCFLMLGSIGWERNLHPVRLTRDEQRTHFALWCLRSSPLILGGDPCALDTATAALLTNDEVIALDRDPLAQPARRVVLSDVQEAWVRPLAGGAVAVGLFNRDEAPAAAQVTWAQLGLPGTWRVRDLWRGRWIPADAAGWSGRVPRHGVELFRLEPAGP